VACVVTCRAALNPPPPRPCRIPIPMIPLTPPPAPRAYPLKYLEHLIRHRCGTRPGPGTLQHLPVTDLGGGGRRGHDTPLHFALLIVLLIRVRELVVRVFVVRVVVDLVTEVRVRPVAGVVPTVAVQSAAAAWTPTKRVVATGFAVGVPVVTNTNAWGKAKGRNAHTTHIRTLCAGVTTNPEHTRHRTRCKSQINGNPQRRQHPP
jgi:hypothetical protein